MTGGNVINILQDNEASVVSGITSADSINTDRGLSVDDKREKNEIYLSTHWTNEDEYEVTN